MVQLGSAILGVSSASNIKAAPYSGALSISIQHSTTYDLVINLNSTCDDGSSVQVFYPPLLIFEAGNIFQNMPVNYIGDIPMSCTLNFTLVGTTTSQYEVIYTKGGDWAVLGPGQYQPRPMLSSARFSSAGEAVLLRFSSATNRGNLAASFQCNLLLSFSMGSNVTTLQALTQAKCTWQDDISISVYSAYLDIGDNISLISSTAIASACFTAICAPNGPFEESVVIVSTATDPTPPIVILSHPRFLGPSATLSLDLTSSSGHGGRDWKSVEFYVYGSIDDTGYSYNVSHIQEYLDANSSIFPPARIPSNLLIPGESFTISVTLCNFLDSCGRTETFVSVLSEEIPEVRILGPRTRYIRRKVCDNMNKQC